MSADVTVDTVQAEVLEETKRMNEEEFAVQTETTSQTNFVRTMLYRHPSDKMVAGVCGGVADYLGWDPVLIRILWIVFTLATGGGGFAAYLALAVLLPIGTREEGQLRPAAIELNERNLSRVAYVLIGLGGLWLLSNVGILSSLWGGFWAVMRLFFWPAVLITVGYMLLSNRDKENWRDSLSGMTSRIRTSSNGKTAVGTEWKSSLRSARQRLPLKRSQTDRVFMGVCGGIGQRMGIDANLVRLVWAAFSIGSIGMGVLVYVLVGLLLPEGTAVSVSYEEAQDVQIVEGSAKAV